MGLASMRWTTSARQEKNEIKIRPGRPGSVVECQPMDQ